MKKIYFLLIALAFTFVGFGQSIFTNPITGTNPNNANPYTTGQTVNANITVSGIGRGSGAVGTNANDRYTANSWNTTTIDQTAYFEFTLTPNSGYEIDFTSFIYTGQRSATGPSNFAFRSSLDGFASNIGSPTATGATINLSALVYQNITSAITFRFYAWNTTNSGGTFSINDFTFNGTVTSTCPTYSLPFTENFEAGVVPPTCWTSFRGTNNAGVNEDWKISANGDGQPNGGYAARVDPDNSAVSISEDWLVTPAIDLSATTNNVLKFYAKDFFNTDQGSTYSVRVSTQTPNIADFTTTLVTYTEAQLGNSYNQKTINLSSLGASTVYIAFVMTGPIGGGDAFILDTVSVTGDCSAPTTQASAFNATAIDGATGTATLNWTGGNGGNRIVVVREGTPVTTDPTSGIDYADDTTFGSGDEIGIGNFVVYNGTGTSVNISGLSVSTTYHVAIYEYNTASNCYNLTQLTGNFFVPCVATFPLTEGFEGGVIPNCWSVFDNGIGYPGAPFAWNFDNFDPYNGSNFSAHLPYDDSNTGTAEDWLVSAPIDLTSVPNGELKFYTKDGFTDVYGSTFKVKISIASQTNPTDFTTIATYVEDPLAVNYIGNTYNQKTINLSAYNNQTIYVAFVMEQDTNIGGDDWYLDDITISAPVASTESDIVEAGFDEPDDINYLSYSATSGLTTSNAIKIGEFTIRDGGSTSPDGDSFSTTLTDLNFTVSNFGDIAALALFDGTSNLSEASGTNVAATTTFSGLNLVAPDNGTKTFDVYATFKSTVTDNHQIQLTIASATASAAGSTFAATNAGGAQTSIAGNDNKIEVTATAWIFDQQPTDTDVNAVMSLSPSLWAVDSNVNIDLDYVTVLSLSTTGTFSGSATTSVAPVAGVVTFDNLIFSATGTNFTLTTAPGLVSDTSSSFDILALPTFGWQIEMVNQLYTIDFETTVTNVNNGAYAGTGFTQNPNSGQLNSSAWATTGMSDGFSLFDGTNTTGDFARGLNTGGVTTAGFYSFNVGSGNRTLGVQPTSEFNPGTIALKSQNQTGQTVTSITFQYTIYVLNNDNRSNSFNSSYSYNNSSYTNITALDFASTATSDNNGWTATQKNITLTGLSIPPGSNFYFRWRSEDISGSGSRDEFGLDDIRVIFNPVVNSSTSNIVENGFDEPDNIDYTTYTTASGLNNTNSIKIGEFKLQDGDGVTNDGDMASTTLTDITFDVLNPSFIKTLAIFDDMGTNVSEVTSVTSSTSFTGLNLHALDNSSKVFSVYATFTTNVTDNEQIQLTVNSATALLTGSTFATLDAGGAQTSIAGDDNKIEVLATDLVFDQQPTDTGLDAIMTPAVTLVAWDSNANLDLDFNELVSLTSTGTFSASATTNVNAVSGIVTFNNLIFSAPGTDLTLTSASSLTDDTSDVFDIAVFPLGIAFQSFGADGGNWNYTTDPATFNVSGDVWDVVDNTFFPFSTIPSDGSFFFGVQDLESPSGTNSGEYGSLTFDTVSVAGYENVVVSFDYEVFEFDGGDDIDYEYYENGILKGTRTTIVSGNSNFSTNGTISISATPGVDNVGLIIYVKQNGAGDYAALDNFNVTGFRKVFNGNQLTGFGGPIGTSTLEIIADAGNTINFKLNKGTGEFNDYMVIYIDSKAGGINTTANLTDTGDDGRKAISGFDGTNRSTVTFPPGFLPDYAISINNGFAGLFEIVENGAHAFVTSANLSPTNNNNATSYTFDIDFSEIGTTQGSESFKFLATYINASNAFRSNESYGRNTASGNPGAAPFEMETYYQVSNAKQGGKAPTQTAGDWTSNATWLNGNAPLAMDEITINHDTDQNIDVSTNGIVVNAALNILPSYTLTTSEGITGAGTLEVSGKLSITQGGYTDLIPTYSTGSTLEYKDVTDPVYNRFNEWNTGSDVGSGVPDNVILDNTFLDLTSLGGNTSDEDFNIGTNLSVLNGGVLNIDPTKNLTVGNTINNVDGSVNLHSTSQRYASIIANSVSGSGIFNYDRFTNQNDPGSGATTGGNDLVSAPFSGQNFASFAAANPNIVSDPNNADRKLFGPFEKVTTGSYVIYNQLPAPAGQGDEILAPGVGYRAASNIVSPSTTGGTFTYSGAMNTGPISQNIIHTPSLNFPEWNLIGNPYPSYINVFDFLDHEVAPGIKNIDLMLSSGSALYGYDGSASDGWITYNLLTDPSTLIAPGQGFFVTADPTLSAAHDIEFTPDMRRTGTSDDFIEGRSSENLHLKLQASKGTSVYKTDFYFTDMTTSGLDRGYDAVVYGNDAPNFSLYSHLVQNNTGKDMGIQALAKTALDSEIIVPLGINVAQGQQVVVSIAESNLPDNVSVYLEDNAAGTFTLLNTTNYTFTAATTLNDTGRFFLRFANNTLSTPNSELSGLEIYSTTSPRALYVKGQLNSETSVSLFDIQGRVVLTSVLHSGTNTNQVDVSKISSGIYVVKLSNDSQQRTQRVIIK